MIRVLILWEEPWALYRGRRATLFGKMQSFSRWMPVMPGDAFEYRITAAAEATDCTGWASGYHVCHIRDGRLVPDPERFREIST